MVSTIQPTFAGGEVDPAIYARVDIAKYATALKTCRNYVVRKQGGVSNRPGTRFIVETKDSTKKSRLIPFEFGTEQAYILGPTTRCGQLNDKQAKR